MGQRIDEDTVWMMKALRLAERGLGRTAPNPPVGAVVVRRGQGVGEGCHRKAGGPHAEVHALRAAGNMARGATLYVTLEPCSTHGRTPPCTEAICASGVARVVAAMSDPNPLHRGRGFRQLRRQGIEVVVGVGRAEAGALIAPFAKWVTTGRPWVTLKLAMTVDGRIADMNGSSKWITCPAARRRVQKLRRAADAIVVGSTTVVRDDPGLLLEHAPASGPLRVVLDSRGAISPSCRLLSDAYRHKTIMATTSRCPASRRARYAGNGAEVLVLPSARGHVSIPSLLHCLAQRGVLHLLCEGGGGIAASLVESDLVDDYFLFMAPRLLGGGGSAAFAGMGWPLQDTPWLRFEQVERVGDDLLIRASARSAPPRAWRVS